MAQVIALDALIFIYVINADPEFGPHARTILKLIELGLVQAVSSQLTYLEALASPKLQPADLAEIERLLDRSSVNFYSVDMSVLNQAAALRRRYGLRTPDAIHIATALNHKATHFVTNDHKILNKKIPGIIITPLATIQEADFSPRA